MMDIAGFLSLKNPEKYDFSNEGARYSYTALSGFDKFFVYMGLAKLYSADKDNIMKYGADFGHQCKEYYGNVIDADSESKLLQSIYQKLWGNIKPMKFCRKGDGIQGDTMNSANTSFDDAYKVFELETEEQRKERKSIKNKKGSQSVSARYLISRYAENPVKFKSILEKIKGLEDFLNLYHTLGNFIPVPSGCNGPRGIGATKDYFDLTLNIIYDYYTGNKDEIKTIVGEKHEEIEIYKKWLDAFEGHCGKDKWNNFVTSNFLQDFVNSEDNGWGRSKELWKGHFAQFANGQAIFNTKEQCEEFFVNASSWIVARGERMKNELISRCIKK